jgi:hypothetical protein
MMTKLGAGLADRIPLEFSAHAARKNATEAVGLRLKTRPLNPENS